MYEYRNSHKSHKKLWLLSLSGLFATIMQRWFVRNGKVSVAYANEEAPMKAHELPQQKTSAKSSSGKSCSVLEEMARICQTGRRAKLPYSMLFSETQPLI
eukprot:TRINITY_DN10429_c0_g1_i2.p2 TRINITY_DN10429_c0_g1~~TRINITY_DN10429_c0_g1_i2.p2  ORF type:complete len:100 (-),score=10.26 TRINITY_DN10429_c0_g1_i2:890-1189(-)